jgi:polyphosphate kinase
MAATEAALAGGDGVGIEADTELIPGNLLVADVDQTDTAPDEMATSDDDTDEFQSDGGDRSVFDAHAEHWYHPDSETYDWAVRTTDGDRRYFITREGARERLRSEYE